MRREDKTLGVVTLHLGGVSHLLSHIKTARSIARPFLQHPLECNIQLSAIATENQRLFLEGTEDETL